MSVFVIAKKIHRTFGHGDFGEDIVIPIINGYDGSRDTRFAYLKRSDAERIANADEIIVELDVV